MRYDYKEEIKDVFNKAASGFDETGTPYFKYFGEKLVEFSDIRPNDKILDIGCGKGAVTFPASKRLSREGQITGILATIGLALIWIIVLGADSAEHILKEGLYRANKITKEEN